MAGPRDVCSGLWLMPGVRRDPGHSLIGTRWEGSGAGATHVLVRETQGHLCGGKIVRS